MQEGFNRYRKISTKVQTRCLQRSVSNFFLSSELLLSKNSNPLFQASLQRMSALTCIAKEMHFQALGASKETIKTLVWKLTWTGVGGGLSTASPVSCPGLPRRWSRRSSGAPSWCRSRRPRRRRPAAARGPAASRWADRTAGRKQKQGAWNGHGGGFSAR